MFSIKINDTLRNDQPITGWRQHFIFSCPYTVISVKNTKIQNQLKFYSIFNSTSIRFGHNYDKYIATKLKAKEFNSLFLLCGISLEALGESLLYTKLHSIVE